jgi:3-hydroxymyristoyl/3-hydroxydecanoyl-(acyl carrier protein) dehydratase
VILTTAGGALQPGESWPVTLVAEALAQSILLVAPPPGGEDVRLVALDKVRQLRQVTAGDRLEVEVAAGGTFGPLHRFSCRALCGGALVATAEITVTG